MSGIEVVGVILGAFPLAIAAMEHLEDSKKVAGTFFKIRRAFRKDLGKLKDCQLKFRLNLKELLIPLLVDANVTTIEYEHLLASPGGDGWKDDHVDEALFDRLGECKERYLELLKEMEEIMVELCNTMKVNDAHFQALLQDKPQKTPSSASSKGHNLLMLRANATFQAKRVAYAFSGDQREALLDEVDRYNQRLEDILRANDRISVAQEGGSKVTKPRISKSLLGFWRHADAVFKLLRDGWKCNCRAMHRAQLWLQHRTDRALDLKVVFQYCHGKEIAGSPWNRQPIDIKFAGRTDPSVGFRPRAGGAASRTKAPTISIQQSQSSMKRSSAVSTSSTCTTTQESATDHKLHLSSLSLDECINDMSLCTLISSSVANNQPQPCLGKLIDENSQYQYTVFAGESRPVSQRADQRLADLLTADNPDPPNRVQRYAIALTLASSHLQFLKTSWLDGSAWTANDVHFPLHSVEQQNGKSSLGEPYIVSTFNDAADSISSLQGSPFTSLAICLLELCFGKSLDSHRLWSQPGFDIMRSNPMFQQMVASEWLKEAEGEAGEGYAAAIRWCLHHAPMMAGIGLGSDPAFKDEKWRTDFAGCVVAPLLRCYESMLP